MDVLKRLLAVVEGEEKEGSSRVNSEWAEETWFEEGLPALNEMNLLLLVGLRHEVERRLVVLAALVDKDRVKGEIRPNELDSRIESLSKLG